MRKSIIFFLLFVFTCLTSQSTGLEDRTSPGVFSGQMFSALSLVEDSLGQKYFLDISAGQRLLSDDPVEIMRRIEQLNKSDGFNIVFLGDSIVYGDGTRDERKTIPALLKDKLSRAKKGQVINVFNFTLPSAGPADVYLITRELAKAKVDLFIYDLNVGWLEREVTLEHPVLLNLSENEYLDPAGFHVYNLDQVLVNSYNIYEEDENLTDLATPWTQKNWDGVFNPVEHGKFGRLHPEWSEQWRYVQKIVDLLQENNMNSLFFTNPRNFELLEKYDDIDFAAYYSSLQNIFNYFDSTGVTILNLDYVVPSEYFSDVVHLLPGGEEIVSGHLYYFITRDKAV